MNTKSLLGGALSGQKKYADAQPLLLAGYEEMMQLEKTIPSQSQIRILEAIERLVLYEAREKRRSGEMARGIGSVQGGANARGQGLIVETLCHIELANLARSGLTHEWHLVFPKAFQHLTFGFVPWFHQTIVRFGSTFFSAWFKTVGAIGNPVAGNRVQ